jgi:hypothetical protein
MTGDYYLTISHLPDPRVREDRAMLSGYTHRMVSLLGNTCVIMYQNTISQKHIVPHLLYMFGSFVIPLNASQERLQSLIVGSRNTIFYGFTVLSGDVRQQPVLYRSKLSRPSDLTKYLL